MKDIKSYNAPKYKDKEYIKVEKDIYLIKYKDDKEYVTSISFIQEPEFGEGSTAIDISQYPLEDLLEENNCYLREYYEELNTEESQRCYVEIAGFTLKDIRKVRAVIGKHMFNKEEKGIIQLIIE